MKYGDQRDPITPRFDRKFGTKGVEKPGGMDTENNPASIAPWDFRLLTNARWRLNGMACRGGMIPLFDGPLHDEAACLHPALFDQGTPLRLWAIVDGCPDESTATGFSTIHVDPEQDPELQPCVWYQTGVTGVIGKFGGDPYIITDDQLRKINLIRVPFGTPNLRLAGGSQDVPIGDPFTGFTGRALFEKFGRLFISLDAGGGASKIVSYDGKTFYPELSAIDPVLAFGEWRDLLVAGFASATGAIRVRTSAGVWTTVAAVGVGARQSANAILSFKDKLCIASGSTKLWIYDGAAWTSHTVGGATINAIASAYGGLHYAGAFGGIAKMGRSDDLITFNDAYKDFTDEFADATDVRALALYRDVLAAGVLAAPLNTFVYESPGEETDGDYRTLVTNAGDIRHFVVI